MSEGRITRSVETPTSNRVVEYGGVVYLGGVGALNRDVGMYEQAREAFGRIEEFMASVGASKSNLLTITIYISSHELKSEMDRAWHEWVDPANKPTRATISVGEMGDNLLIEAVATVAR